MVTAPDLKKLPSIAPSQPQTGDDETDVSALIARLTGEVNQIACEKTKSIQQITNQMKMLALNALIESSRAGAQGAGFAVVAQEVRGVGQQVETIARELETQLTKRTGDLVASIDGFAARQTSIPSCVLPRHFWPGTRGAPLCAVRSISHRPESWFNSSWRGL